MLIGRAPERAAITEVLRLASGGSPSAIALVGEPGIGKTMLLTEATRLAHAESMTVLIMTGTKAEEAIPAAAVVRMLDAHPSRIARPPTPHRTTLEALTGGAEPVPPVALGLAVLAFLTDLAHNAPLLVAVDDAHWLDTASAQALHFARRRLHGDRVAVVLASRPEAPIDEEIRSLHLAGLGADDTRALLVPRAGVSPTVAEACRRACGGNPLAMLEMAHALTGAQRRGEAELPIHPPVGRWWDRWAQARLAELPPATRTALGLLSLAGQTGPGVLSSALGCLGLTGADLDPAVTAGIVAKGTPPQFAHPLYAGAAEDALGPDGARAAHRALAAAVAPDDLPRRAWHLAEGTEGDAAEAVSALVTLGQVARAHNDHLTAAEAWRRAGELADNPAERAEHLVAGAGAAWDAGRPDLAVSSLQLARTLVPAGSTHAIATRLLGEVLGWTQWVPDARRLLESEVPLIADSHPELATALLVTAARLAVLEASPEAPALAVQAEAVAARADDDARLSARVMATFVSLASGAAAEALVDRLHELDSLRDAVAGATDHQSLELAELLGDAFLVRERWDEARSIFGMVVDATRAASFSGLENFATAMSAEAAWRTGRWSRARAEARVSVIFHAAVPALGGHFGDATLARTEAALGLVESAVAHAQRAIDRGDATGMTSLSAWGRHALGLAALADGRPHDALEPLRWIWRVERTGGVEDPGILWFHGDLIEALVATGHLDDAARFVSQLEEAARVTGRVWARAVALRGRGLLSSDPDALRESATLLDALGAPFEAARSRLALAELALAEPMDDDLDAALGAFESLGARPWLERAVRLRSTAPRPEAAPALAAVLTPAELRVALAVGQGLTNREAADLLAVSPRTIDAHLQSIYRKLGVTSRTRLALRVSEELP